MENRGRKRDLDESFSLSSSVEVVEGGEEERVEEVKGLRVRIGMMLLERAEAS